VNILLFVLSVYILYKFDILKTILLSFYVLQNVRLVSISQFLKEKVSPLKWWKLSLLCRFHLSSVLPLSFLHIDNIKDFQENSNYSGQVLNNVF
jgi:hypothetical protein